MCDIKIYHLIEGAKQAEGLTVIIDVFRAFSLECYLYDMGAELIRPVGTIQEAERLREEIKGSILIGERHGRKCEGFDFGNSPCSIEAESVRGKTILHTTSAGTQGIVNAAYASEIITGSLVNARAVAAYIKKMKPKKVSLVCMGNEGVSIAKEDELCARYIKSLIEEKDIPDMDECVRILRTDGGEKFFDPNNQEVFPQADFWKCIDYDRFPFVIRVSRDEIGYRTQKIDMDELK